MSSIKDNILSRFEAGVRAIGLCSASGLSVTEIVNSIQRQQCSLGPLKRNSFILGSFIGGEVPIECRVDNRAMEILLLALEPALKEAHLTETEKLRTGVFVGTTSGFVSESEILSFNELSNDDIPVVRFKSRGVGEVGLKVARHAGVGGPVLSYSIACTSSAFALLEAWRFLRAGVIDHAIVVGFETLLNTTMHGFKSLMLYDPGTYKPFDKHRRGLQLGEGCGVIILDGQGKGNYPFAMVGGSARNDHSNIAGADVAGGSVVRVLEESLGSAGLRPEDIIAIKAHGTGTLDNDLGEGIGFGKFFSKVPKFASIKGYMGHTLGAAGALEVGTWSACLSQGFIPRSLGFQTVDEAIKLTPTLEAYGSTPGHYLHTFFGFGGSSVGLVFEMRGNRA